MNIETANMIPIPEILNKIGLSPVKNKGHEYWYFSPFRKEKTASFHVNVQKNVWFDFGLGTGGDVVRLVCMHLENSGVLASPKEALRWLKNMFQSIDVAQFIQEQGFPKEENRTVLRSTKKLQHPALVQYLASRGIPLSIAQDYLHEIRIFNTETQKQFFAIGIKNEEGGYEYRNLYFKGCVGKKSITFIRGEIPKPPSINIFEGFMDFLTLITQREGKKFDGDTIILNSLSQMKEAIYVGLYINKLLTEFFLNETIISFSCHAIISF